MSPIVTISPDDLDITESIPAAKALGNLARVHQLPRLEHVFAIENSDGHAVLSIAVPEAAADQWRAALGAPQFTTENREHYTRHKTERTCWFGATVRLYYATL